MAKSSASSTSTVRSSRVLPTKTRLESCGSAKFSPRCSKASAQVFHPLVADRAWNDHHRAGQLPRIVAAKVRHQRPRASAAGGSEHERIDFLPRPDEVSDRSHDLSLANEDIHFDARLVENFADSGTDHAFDPEALLFLDRSLHPAKLYEVLRLDDSKHLDFAARLGGPAGSEAERDARFRAVVDDDQVGASRIGLHLL